MVLAASQLLMAATASALTSNSATAAFRAAILADSPTAVFPANEGTLCPEIYSGSEGAYSVCYGEFETGDFWNIQGGQAKEEENGQIVFTYPTSAQWTRRWTKCRLERAPGTLTSNNNCGYHQPSDDPYLVWDELVPDIRFHRGTAPIGWQFTESAGFTSIGIFHGSKHGKTYTFSNAVGDSFRYRP